METKIIYAIMATILLVTIFKFLPAKYNFFLVRTNRKKFKKTLIFDEKLNFFRLEKHYLEKVFKEKIFDDKVKKEIFLKTASSCIVRTILKSESAYSSLTTTLEGSKLICERNPDLKKVLSLVGEDNQLRDFLIKQLEKYKKSLNESDYKNNPEQAREISRNNLKFFFLALEHEDVLETKLNTYFKSEKKDLKEDLKGFKINNFSKPQQVTSN